MSLIIAVLMLGIIIATHGFGHSLLAKLNGIGMIEFPLSMGPRLISFEEGSIRYSFKILSFGGSRVMLGEDENEADEYVLNSESAQTRISVAAAGLIFSFLLALLLSMALIGATGYDTTQLNGVLDDYLAQVVGMRAGDVIRSTNGRRVHSYRDINMYLFTYPQKQVEVTQSRIDSSGVERAYSVGLAPAYSQENDQYMISVQFDPASRQVEYAEQLLLHGLYEVQYWIRYMFGTFHMMLCGPAFLNGISGPVGIVMIIDGSVDETPPCDISTAVLILMQLTILLGANLGVMNPLPIPALDDGRLAFLIIEAVGGKPTGKGKEGMVHVVGMVVLLALIVLILFNDVHKLFWQGKMKDICSEIIQKQSKLGTGSQGMVVPS